MLNSCFREEEEDEDSEESQQESSESERSDVINEKMKSGLERQEKLRMIKLKSLGEIADVSNLFNSEDLGTDGSNTN